MQIQLKQTEIVTALKQYIAAQGINLHGKNVDITFTASRSAAGIVADIMIDETNVPVINNHQPRVDVPVTMTPAPAIEPHAEEEGSPAVEEPPRQTASLFA